ncbi:hypothetical protein TNIN_200151 [Trichonephila inaurata madagascariensis]|uniref:Uncharacterized protein n=1 Tax=Trichonephila inaurata madagascariensis TaxID=2747483 RepID=A0A8X6YNS1_9ARAC|nr:hypothetical protein TNIN_200151 [Trichonephila inaurata madagascariensis]
MRHHTLRVETVGFLMTLCRSGPTPCTPGRANSRMATPAVKVFSVDFDYKSFRRMCNIKKFPARIISDRFLIRCNVCKQRPFLPKRNYSVNAWACHWIRSVEKIGRSLNPTDIIFDY